MSFWFDIDSSMILSHCGENTQSPLPHALPFTIKKDNKLATALDKTGGCWHCDINHVHQVEFDLGKPHYITSIRGLLASNTNIKEVRLYIADAETGVYGDPVLDIRDWQDYTPIDDYRYDITTPILGRFMRLYLIGTTDPDNYLRWG
jgi:hypothetical protein